jgi:hypothetical protein
MRYVHGVIINCYSCARFKGHLANRLACSWHFTSNADTIKHYNGQRTYLR